MYDSNEREKEQKKSDGKRQVTWWSVWNSPFSFVMQFFSGISWQNENKSFMSNIFSGGRKVKYFLPLGVFLCSSGHALSLPIFPAVCCPLGLQLPLCLALCWSAPCHSPCMGGGTQTRCARAAREVCRLVPCSEPKGMHASFLHTQNDEY